MIFYFLMTLHYCWCPFGKMKYLFKFIYSFLRSETKAKAPRWVLPLNTQSLEKFGGKWRTGYLNTSFPLPTLLCAEYSVKLTSTPRRHQMCLHRLIISLNNIYSTKKIFTTNPDYCPDNLLTWQNFFLLWENLDSTTSRYYV